MKNVYFLPRPQLHLKIFLLMIAILSLMACNNLAAAPPPPPPKVQTSVQFSWVPTIEFAGFYMAEAEGEYVAENLAVTMMSGGYDEGGDFIDPIERVVSGQADFGIADGGTLLTARAGGTPVVAIATIYQRSPVAFVSFAEKEIVKPEDLVGKTVQYDPFTTGVVYEAMLRSERIDKSQINEVQREDFTIQPLLSGETDVLDGWVTNEVVDLTLQGHEVNVILPSDYGIVMYPNVIFTTEAMIADNPELVEKFVRATLKGMQSAIAEPDMAAETVVAQVEGLSLEKEQEAMQRSLPLLNPSDSSPGQMQPAVWEKTHEILLEQGILSEPLDLEAAYTLAFLE
jgi:NitT/TauT family transport system substrate-binding protein